MSAAIAGSEVAITVESVFSMKSAVATISGTRRFRVMISGVRVGLGRGSPLLSHKAARPRPLAPNRVVAAPSRALSTPPIPASGVGHGRRPRFRDRGADLRRRAAAAGALRGPACRGRHRDEVDPLL